MDALSLIMPMLVGNPKVKTTLESVFGQPADYVLDNFNKFLGDVSKGPGIQHPEEEKIALFNRYYQGGLSMGFADWESELASALLSGYTPMDVCISFRQNRHWKETTIDNINTLKDNVIPRFVEKAQACGLMPKEEKSIPQTEIKTQGGNPPWADLVNGAKTESV